MNKSLNTLINQAKTSLYLSNTDDEVLDSIFIHESYILKQKNKLQQQNLELIKKYQIVLKTVSEFINNQISTQDTLMKCGALTYLIWEGLLSKNQNFIYDARNESNVLDCPGYLGMDVINGVGCCRHISSIAYDILKFDNVNLQLINNCEICSQDFLYVDIHRNSVDGTLKKDTLTTYEVIKPQKFNHVCLLFQDKSHYFIYDPTNILLYNLKDVVGRQMYGDGSIVVDPLSIITYSGIAYEELQFLFKQVEQAKKIRNDETYIRKIIYGADCMRENSNACKMLYKEIEPNIETIYQYKLKRDIKRRQMERRLTKY